MAETKKTSRSASEKRFNVAIYEICCPDTGEPKYVGISKNPRERFKQHISDASKKKTRLYCWIKNLLLEGKCPVMNIFAYADNDSWEQLEKEFIFEYRKHHTIYNIADGGKAPYCPKDTRKSNGAKVAQNLHDDEFRKRVWKLKLNVGIALKNGYLSETAKEKLRYAAKKRPDLFGIYANV